ncbi:6-phosphogluconolactonase [Methylicorpusculum oleiharenae]|uniref:6-phosphogluconolactonase n=1 Tax=Methylicorpusculum oleiharenae TaxID=1338687 RepID=UPI00135ADB12|nr:6-phosphogluconolactonase [Methylicorpusculum oleiharenae]MCD2449364.1 6-phosphogluconolactonase [Methylicorpusculum oleiharenae]
MQKIHWHSFATAEKVAAAASQQILTAAEQAIKERGVFKLVLAGGSTPDKVYHLLSESRADWANWHIYYGDERCLPADHPERNSQMAQASLLGKVAIPAEQIHTMPTELGPEPAAAAYREVIAGVDSFDTVLLGMGEDGHTASLFPGHVNSPDETVHAIYNSPKPPPERVSLSAKTLSQTRQLLFLVTGEGKRDAVQQWRQGIILPVALIRPESGVDVYVDAAALG